MTTKPRRKDKPPHPEPPGLEPVWQAFLHHLQAVSFARKGKESEASAQVQYWARRRDETLAAYLRGVAGEQQTALLDWARSLTTTNCDAVSYRIGQAVLAWANDQPTGPA